MPVICNRYDRYMNTLNLDPELVSRFVSPILTAVILYAVFFMSSRFAFSKRAQFKDGWYYLRASMLHLIVVILGAAMTGFMSYLYLFVGSALPDAEWQMTLTFWMGVSFNLMTILCAYSIIVEQVRWNKTHIECRDLLLKRYSMSWYELAHFGQTNSGDYWISSYDGPRIRFSPYQSGVADLIMKILEHLPPDTPAADQAAAEAAALRFAVAGVAR